LIILGSDDFEVILVVNQFAGVDVNPDCGHEKEPSPD
jgi:hypothetical protein